MLQGLTGWHLVVVVAVILLLFGSTKLPALARSLGQSARAFKGEMKAMREEDAEVAPATATVDAAASAPPAAAAAAARVADTPSGPAGSPDPAPAAPAR
ncbi:Sec-independent protein translocase subunit TatA [Agromyces sp. MMS24-JH15]|uniref:Sec-independent protein translocase subunit TatA n=1 Tax=Agromyces sp. MMS24-JH15 TaxID=3243765 RepID=UPI003747E18E